MNKLVTSFILIVVAVGLSMTYTRGELSLYNEIKSEAESYDKALSQAEELSALRQDLLTGLDEIDLQDRKRLEKFIPRNIDTVRLTIEVSSIAEQAGMEVTQFSFTERAAEDVESESSEDSADIDMVADPTIEGAGAESEFQPESIQTSGSYSLVDMTLGVDGNYDQLKKFVEKLEDNLRLTDIQSINITEAEEGKASYQIVIRTYWLGK